jgi:hypothetical protein
MRLAIRRPTPRESRSREPARVRRPRVGRWRSVRIVRRAAGLVVGHGLTAVVRSGVIPSAPGWRNGFSTEWDGSRNRDIQRSCICGLSHTYYADSVKSPWRTRLRRTTPKLCAPRGSRTSSWHRPSIDMAALTGIGLGARPSRSRERDQGRVAPPGLFARPPWSASTISETSRGTRFATTERTPSAPTFSRLADA